MRRSLSPPPGFAKLSLLYNPFGGIHDYLGGAFEACAVAPQAAGFYVLSLLKRAYRRSLCVLPVKVDR